ncbi:MAG: winged helix-turn-helix transcriptional regulator [Agathobacter sp.]|nr:winged helix-turn-helix transcriptional regulator [Agathobacter sp.]
MLHIASLSEGLEVFKALGSDVRVEILNILMENNKIGMNELATRLKITNGALTGHIKKLEGCGLISISNESARHGNQKIYTVHLDKILIDLQKIEEEENVYSAELSVGHYSSYQVSAACGLASEEKIIGVMDDERYFGHPERYEAQMLWFHNGYVEYNLPNFIPAAHKITQISVSLELGSGAVERNHLRPSNIIFYLNNVFIGGWTSPGIIGAEKGLYTPEWWNADWNQYGLLKMLVINQEGVYVDGLKISDMNIAMFHLNHKSDIRLRLAVDEKAEHAGGLAIFGKGFGNYGQGIKVNISYEAME